MVGTLFMKAGKSIVGMLNKIPSTWLVLTIMNFKRLFPKKGAEIDSSIQMVNAQTWEILVIHKDRYTNGIPDNRFH